MYLARSPSRKQAAQLVRLLILCPWFLDGQQVPPRKGPRKADQVLGLRFCIQG